MNVTEALRFAWQGVTANKTRSALTTLGILIGVAAVIILVAVGTGSSKAVQDSISSLGSNTLTVTASQSGGGGLAGRRRGRLPGRSGGGLPRTRWRRRHHQPGRDLQPGRRADDGRRRGASPPATTRTTCSASRRS